MENIHDYSNPAIVARKARKIFGKDVELQLSTRKAKKYMIKNPNGKWIHFGQMYPPMEDYTKHNDLLRRDNYLRRNAKYANAPMYSPGFLSYYLLW